MDYYKIADLSLAVQGVDYPYFQRRMQDYRLPQCESPAMEISFAEREITGAPEGKLVATSNGFRQFYKSGSGGYHFFDLLRTPDIYSAAISADQNFGRIEMSLRDIEPLGGAPLGVRCLNMLGEAFRYFVLLRSGMVLHSSCIAYKGQGIAFSAPSGTGKSTHTGLWKKYFGDAVTVINDDSPVVRFLGERPVVCGTPWSGKTEINCDLSAPLKAVIMLEQKKENTIRRLEPQEAIFRLMQEVTRPVYPEFMELTLGYIEKLVLNVPVYLMGCTISKEAVETAQSVL